MVQSRCNVLIIIGTVLLSIMPAKSLALALSLSLMAPSFVPSRPSPPSSFLSQSLQRQHRRSLSMPPLHVVSNDNDDYGLTDDGDFAILGVNAEERTDDNDDEANKKDASLRNANVNTGTSIGSQGVGNMLFNEELMQSGRVDLGVGPTNTYRNFRGNDIVPKIDPAGIQRVSGFDWEILPSLEESDVTQYAEGLSNIGFNPQCASLCELEYQDLDFMKVLHRKYLQKEIMGEEHQFEP